ncbi:MAG TPA: RcnB family protein [Ancylobacter sp.]
MFILKTGQFPRYCGVNNMKRPIIAALVLSFIGAGAAVAQPMPYYGNNKQVHTQQHTQNYRAPAPGRPGYNNHGPHRSHWSKGKRLPSNYRGNVVRDYGRYRLPPPRRDQRWVKVNNEYLLIGITSGIIASMVQGR